MKTTLSPLPEKKAKALKNKKSDHRKKISKPPRKKNKDHNLQNLLRGLKYNRKKESRIRVIKYVKKAEVRK